MRGECYVRLLVHPDAASAKKAGQELVLGSSRSFSGIICGVGRSSSFNLSQSSFLDWGMNVHKQPRDRKLFEISITPKKNDHT